MQTLDPIETLPRMMKQLVDGAFLTVKAGEQLNTMTIGWASGGIMWGKPVLMVVVRPSRFTFEIIEQSLDFTVSLPLCGMKEELMFCGTRSGRTTDKFTGCAICIENAQKTVSPVIKLEGIHYECRIVQVTAMNPDRASSGIKSSYPKGDFHNLYFGEIMACYQT